MDTCGGLLLPSGLTPPPDIDDSKPDGDTVLLGGGMEVETRMAGGEVAPSLEPRVAVNRAAGLAGELAKLNTAVSPELADVMAAEHTGRHAWLPPMPVTAAELLLTGVPTARSVALASESLGTAASWVAGDPVEANAGDRLARSLGFSSRLSRLSAKQ